MRRANATIALTLILVLGIGPMLSLAAMEKPAGPAILHSKRGPVRSRAPRASKPLQMPTLLEGQTSTTLPDGRILLIGGLGEDGPSSAITIQNPRTGKIKSLAEMSHGRAWHTATMLPGGRVFVFGGMSADERVLSAALIVDPASGVMEDVRGQSGLTPRARHSATILTDGSVLIAGGLSVKGGPISKAQLWDYQTQKTEFVGGVTVPRSNHKATLLADGNVLLEDGVDENKGEVKNAELFNVDAKSFSVTSISSDENKDSSPYVAASLPADGAIEVPVDSCLALRFSRPLPSDAVKLGTIKLEAIDEGVAAKIVSAENGRLVFITPLESLRKGTSYKVSVTNSADGSVSITPSSVSFTTVSDKDWENRIGNETDWVPSAENSRGNWQTKGEKSEWQDLPPLQAKDGETALSGQVLTLKGQPIVNVTISVKESSTRTDRTGRFLLSISEGHQVMLIDGRTASRLGLVYGIFRAGIDVTGGKTNALPFTIWMPKLDMAHAVKIPSPIRKDTVITNPLIPGLELHLPAGTVIRDLDGRPVTEISITPVPTDRPPFPLPPGLRVPVFASIQPGGARVIPPRARLIYPNYTKEPAGKRINFWNYDPEGRGWYIYGQGTVTPNGRQIVPDPGVVIYEFSGIMIGDLGNPLDWFREAGDADEDGDPVDLSTGLFVLEKTDLVLPDTIPIALTRTYRPGDGASRPFGIGSSHPYELFLWSNNNYQEVDLILPDGGRIHYVRVSSGTGYADAVYEHTTSPSGFYKSQIYWNGTGWDLRLKNGTVFVFPEYAPLQSIRDRYGNQITVTRTNGVLGIITQLTSPNGRWLQFTYGTGDRISQVKDNSGRTVTYTYDGSGRLWKVTDPKGGITEYTYDSSHRMLTIKDARGIVFLTNEYDSNSRVITQTQADSSTYEFDYTLNGSGKVTQTDVTDPRGNVRRLTFNANGYTLTDTFALGTSIEQTFTSERQSGTNLILSASDHLNRETAYTYDSASNLTSITRLAGTDDAVTTTLTYEPNYQQVATITDPLSHTTSLGYDSQGNLTSITDPLSHQTTFTFNTSGQVISMTDALNNTTQWTYDSGDLASLTNPLGHTLGRYGDNVGRPTRTVDALGRATLYEYDAANLPIQVTDAQGEVTSFTYDENGNVLSVTDANDRETTYSYDNMDRLETRTDPLSRDESYEYDDGGNVVKFIDRRGKVTTYTYDELNRVTFAGFGTVVNGGSTTYESTITYSYDTAGRVDEVEDSLTGTITFEYDDFDRVTSETSPRGTVSYAYDDAGRQTSMTVTGRSAVTYTYDNADRLTGISQGSSSATYAYDAANRRTSLTLPNGLVTEYGYDTGSNLTAITYKQGSTVLGDLTYEYDPARRRTKTGGSYARTGLPSALNSATYDTANQMTQRGSTNLTYDDNGNLTSDGTNTYTWDARNQLSSINGGTSASFEYDPFGRRTKKTVSSQTTDYLYDGAEIVQELSNGTPTADMLNGVGVDERLSCNCNGAPRTLLSDGLNSTVALTNSSGAVQTEYTYDPFGATTASGTASSNASQFTGRENDTTGLHYYRARYYSPLLQRFISEDPIGFSGGDVNLYAYVGNSPTNLVDPTGNAAALTPLGIICLEGAIIGAATDAIMNALLGRKITLNGLVRSAVSGCISSLIGFGLGKLLGAALRAGRAGRLPKLCASSFVEGTLVQTENGSKRIEEIRVGDIVLSGNPSDRTETATTKRVVTETFQRSTDLVYDIRIGTETITTTAEHPFWVVGQGWTVASQLRRGSALLTKDGLVVQIDSLKRRQGQFKVFNFEVADKHTYYVGNLGVLVHNACAPPPRRPYAPNDPTTGSPLPIPKGPHGVPASESPFPHTQLGTKVSSGTGQPYTQAREFGQNGQHIRDMHFTNHGRGNHPNPHQHVIDAVTGKRGPPIPFP